MALLCKIRSGPNSPLIGGSAGRAIHFDSTTSVCSTTSYNDSDLSDALFVFDSTSGDDPSKTTSDRFTFTYEGPQKVPTRNRRSPFVHQKMRLATCATAPATKSSSQTTTMTSSSKTTKATNPFGLVGVVKRRHFNAQRRNRVDFVKLFAQKTYNLGVVTEIFSYLRDDDLRAVARVSRLWRRTLFDQKSNYARYQAAEQRFVRNKENVLDPFESALALPMVRQQSADADADADTDHNNKTLPTIVPRSPPRSPHSEKHRKFTKIAETLTETQSLTKCSTCEMPAVCENQIAECTKCSKMWCMRCMQNDMSSPQSRSPTAKAITFNRSPLFNYQHGRKDEAVSVDAAAAAAASATDPNDDHLLSKYYLAAQETRPSLNANSRFAKNGTRSVPPLSLKRVLPFAKLANSERRRRRRPDTDATNATNDDNDQASKTPASASKYTGKFHALCDFSNLIDQAVEVVTTQASPATDPFPAQAASAAAQLVPINRRKRQNFARDHVCTCREHEAQNDETDGSNNELSTGPALNAPLSGSVSERPRPKRAFHSHDANERRQPQQQRSSQSYQSDSSDDLTPPSPKDSRTTKQRLRRLCR